MIVLFIKLHSMKKQITATYRRILGDVNVHFCSLAYRLIHTRRRRMYNLGSNVERTGSISSSVKNLISLGNFQLFAVNNKGNIGNQKLRNLLGGKNVNELIYSL